MHILPTSRHLPFTLLFLALLSSSFCFKTFPVTLFQLPDFTHSLKGDTQALHAIGPETWPSVSGACMLWLVEKLRLPTGTVHPGVLHLFTSGLGTLGCRGFITCTTELVSVGILISCSN